MALKRIWTDDEDRRLLELRQGGRTSISIAAKLKRTAGAVNARLYFLRRATQGHSATTTIEIAPIDVKKGGHDDKVPPRARPSGQP